MGTVGYFKKGLVNIKTEEIESSTVNSLLLTAVFSPAQSIMFRNKKRKKRISFDFICEKIDILNRISIYISIWDNNVSS